MIRITMYEVVNGDKSKPYEIDREFKNDKEVEQFRKELEQKHHCYKTDFTGKKEKVKQIIFYKIMPPDKIIEGDHILKYYHFKLNN